MTEFCRPFHVAMISDVLGIPDEDRALLTTWFVQTMTRAVGDPRIPAISLEGSANLRAYFRGALADRRERPRGDVLTDIALAQIDGNPLGEEAVGVCFQLFAGVADTPVNFLSNCLALLASHPGQRDQLVADPSLIPHALEELMRYEAAEQNVARVTTADFALHGVSVPKGSRVVLVIGSANRDDRRFPDPDQLDLSRRVPRHLGFGEGIHFCLGAPLARLAEKIALESFLRSIPSYQLAGTPQRIAKQSSWGFAHLPAEW